MASVEVTATCHSDSAPPPRVTSTALLRLTSSTRCSQDAGLRPHGGAAGADAVGGGRGRLRRGTICADHLLSNRQLSTATCHAYSAPLTDTSPPQIEFDEFIVLMNTHIGPMWETIQTEGGLKLELKAAAESLGMVLSYMLSQASMA